MEELLAKSPKNGRKLTLLQHTVDVMDAGEWLFGNADGLTRTGKAWLKFFRIPESRHPEFQINLLASAAFHDLGKANDGMLRALKGQGRQVIRHEHLSGLLLGLDEVAGWLLSTIKSIDQDVVLGAVISHHLKVKFDTFAELQGPSFRLYCDHPDFRSLLDKIRERLSLSKIPTLNIGPHCAYRDTRANLPYGTYDIESLRNRVRDARLQPFKKRLQKDDSRCRMLWAVRAALIAADSVASGLWRMDQSLQTWIREAFDERKLCDRSFIWAEVIEKRVEQLNKLGKWTQWSQFQEDCSKPEKVPARALLLAPCGSGKTLAAWRWIAARLGERPTARVIFLYPTRATAKEGFRDYVSWAPESEAALMHGTSAYDLEGMFANEPNDPRSESNYEVERRLFALGYWTRRVFSATVDQFLAFLSYAYGPVCMLPALADSVLVIDEVHSFDRSMFSGLKDFLRTFDIPVLCMTATLRREQEEQLEHECGMTPYNEKPGELRDIAEAPRYRLRQTTTAEALETVGKAIANNKRVLWVVNQVKRAQQAYLDCQTLGLGVPIFCYHSRFRLMDRRRRHDEVVNAFRTDSPPALAITTQVCEMSLDMDADVLITEWCPITSLIQRMGRCNRSRTPRTGAGEVWVYRPLDAQGEPDLNPYDEDSLTGVGQFLATLTKHESVNQVDLENALAAAPQPAARADELCSFLKSGPFAMAHEDPFRDIESFTVSAVMADDVAEFACEQKAKRPIDGFIVPVPRWLGSARDERLPSYVAVAKNEHYHRLIGFCDKLELVKRVGG